MNLYKTRTTHFERKQMKISKVKIKGSWREVADSARTTIGMDEGTKDVSDSWKKKILLAEHSPIRQLLYKWKWSDLPYWVSVHFVRHWLGIIHFVSTQRDDRSTTANQTRTTRGSSRQDVCVKHECEANAQALINISRKRLCNCASKETRQAWALVVNEIRSEDPVLGSVLVPECVYRGFCPEMKSCGYVETDNYKNVLISYRIKGTTDYQSADKIS